MKRIAVLVAFLLSSTGLTAQETARLPADLVAPQAWASSRAANGASGMVSVTRVTAAVRILEGVATTDMLVSLHNPNPADCEASLLLAIPDGAVVRSFDFMGAGAEPSAELLPAPKARGIYRSIVSRLRDPALLEFAGSALVRTSVFPVPAGGDQEIRLAYEHVLPSEGGRLEYVLPRTERLADSAIPYHVSLSIKGRNALAAVYSPTHEMAVTRRSANHVTASLTELGATTPGSLRLLILPAVSDLSASLLCYPDTGGDGGAFLFLAALPPGLGKDRAPVKRELTLVLDRSGSMSGRKIEQAKTALVQVLQGLAEGEAFNILTYNGAVERFSERAVVKTAESEARARAYIAAIEAGGGTNLHDAVLEALAPQPLEGMLPLVMLLSDGRPTVGVTGEGAIRDDAANANRHHRRIYTFGVGHDVNAPLMDRLAEQSRGAMTCVPPEEDVEEKVSVLFDKLTGPVLTSPKLAVVDSDGTPAPARVHDVLPATIPDVYRGDRIVVMGWYRGDGPLRFRLSGELMGTPRHFHAAFHELRPTVRNAFVPRLWASRKIAVLIDALRQAGADSTTPAAAPPHAAASARSARPRSAAAAPVASRSMDARTGELMEEIVRLSTTWGILTEYTAFLAREGTDLSAFRGNSKTAFDNVDRWAVRSRHGGHAMSQQMNNAGQRGQANLNPRNAYYDENMNRVQASAVQQVNDLAFYRRSGRWVDARVASRKIDKADETVAFGSARYWEIVKRMVALDRQGALSLPGGTEFELDGKVIRVVTG